MTRVLKIFPVLLAYTFAFSAFGAGVTKCKPSDLLPRGEKPLYIEDLEIEESDANHKPTCISLPSQDSILWQSKNNKEFKVTLTPIDPNTGNAVDLPTPFYKTGDQLRSVGSRLSSGPARTDLALTGFRWLYYKVKIDVYDENGVIEKTIDPHTAIHTGR